MKYVAIAILIAAAYWSGYRTGNRLTSDRAEEVKALRLLEVRDSVAHRYQEVFGPISHEETHNLYEYVVYGDVQRKWDVKEYTLTPKQ